METEHSWNGILIGCMKNYTTVERELKSGHINTIAATARYVRIKLTELRADNGLFVAQTGSALIGEPENSKPFTWGQDHYSGSLQTLLEFEQWSLLVHTCTIKGDFFKNSACAVRRL